MCKDRAHPEPIRWRIVTNQREVIVRMRSRAHAMWTVATDKREGEKIMRVERVYHDCDRSET